MLPSDMGYTMALLLLLPLAQGCKLLDMGSPEISLFSTQQAAKSCVCILLLLYLSLLLVVRTERRPSCPKVLPLFLIGLIMAGP